MKICRFEPDRIGVVVGDHIADVSDIVNRSIGRTEAVGDAFIAALPDLRERLGRYVPSAPTMPLAGVRLLPPVAMPGKIIGAPVSYRTTSTR